MAAELHRKALNRLGLAIAFQRAVWQTHGRLPYAQVLECIAPGPDDIVLPKTSSNVFTSTNVDYIMRSLEKKYLILAGCVTDQCVESAVREACDKHYYVTLVTGGMLAVANLTSQRLIIRWASAGSVQCFSALQSAA